MTQMFLVLHKDIITRFSEDYRSTHDDGGGVAGVGVHVAHTRDVVVESGVIIHDVLGGRLLGLASETLIIEKVLNRIRMWIFEFKISI